MLDKISKGRILFQMDTMSSVPASRAASSFGSRPVSPYGNRDTLRQQQMQQHAQYQYHQPQMQQQQVEPAYGYSRHESDIM